MADTNEALDDVPQIATRLRVKNSWIYSAVAADRIPFVKVGKYLRFYPSKVMARLAEEQAKAGR